MPNLNKKIVPIKGMHCRSCEILIEEELRKIPGVKKVDVNEKRGIAEVYSEGAISDKHIEKVVCDCGYGIGKDNKSWISTDSDDYAHLLIAGTALFFAYVLLKISGILNINFNSSNNLGSLPVVFLVGLTAGVSTCMALVGGLVLGVSARFSEQHPNATTLQKFQPHIYFNLGRVVIFTILGGIIGYFGSLFQLSAGSIGFLTIFVGVVMLLLGLQTLNMFPVLNRFRLTLPKSLYKVFNIDEKKQGEYTGRNAFILGGLTFFLPCGFTQAMQLFAISSGSALTGALTMGVFALGTIPGLIGIGSLVSVIKGSITKPFFKFVGLAVIALSIFNITNGLNLTGFDVSNTFKSASAQNSNISDSNVTLENGIQIVKMDQTYAGYSPRTFTIKKGIPVKWVVNSKDPSSCASSIYSAQLGIRKSLNAGENIIEFTPSEAGTIKFSCSMGMYTGSFTVVDGSTIGTNSNSRTKGNSNNVAAQVANNPAPQGGNCGASGGGCGCGGGAKNIQPSANVKAETIPSTDGANAQVQLIKATYSVASDIQPNNFTVKANVPVRFEILANDNGSGCMGSVALPGLAQDYYPFQKGETAVFNFTPTQTGTYKITCAMGVPRGTITVN